MNATAKRRTAELLLATVTLFWGSTFPIMKTAISELPVLSFLGIRFAFSAALLALLAGKGLRTLDARGVLRGLFLGLLLFLSYVFQTFGLQYTSAANAGFLTGLNVVWVPVLSAYLLRRPPGPGVRLSVGLAVLGLCLLTWHWPWRLATGDALEIVCSVFVAFHILGLDSLTEGYDGRALAFVQIATMAVLALAGSALWEPVTWPRAWSPGLVQALAVTGVFATVFAFWVQTSFQRWTTPTRAALIYTLEPVFAAAFSVLLAGERLEPLAWTGGALVVAGTVVAQCWPTPAEAEDALLESMAVGQAGAEPEG